MRWPLTDRGTLVLFISFLVVLLGIEGLLIIGGWL